MTKANSIFGRFVKAFIAGGVASIGVLLANGVTFSNQDELKNLLLTLAGAFISGGIMAIEKYLTWTDAPQA